MKRKTNASLLAAQQSFFTEQGITPSQPENKSKKKKGFLDDIDISKLGLVSGDFGEYISKINNRDWMKQQLENAKIKV